jgi:hypothetical protein
MNSIFDDSTYIKYEHYIVTGTLAGFLEIDDRNRKNLIWYAGERTGAEYQNGAFIAPTSGIKIVWVENDFRLHAFPIRNDPNSVNYCSSCGKPLPMW